MQREEVAVERAVEPRGGLRGVFGVLKRVPTIRSSPASPPRAIFLQVLVANDVAVHEEAPKQGPAGHRENVEGGEFFARDKRLRGLLQQPADFLKNVIAADSRPALGEGALREAL